PCSCSSDNSICEDVFRADRLLNLQLSRCHGRVHIFDRRTRSRRRERLRNGNLSTAGLTGYTGASLPGSSKWRRTMDGSEFSKFQRRSRCEHSTLPAQWLTFHL